MSLNVARSTINTVEKYEDNMEIKIVLALIISVPHLWLLVDLPALIQIQENWKRLDGS